MARVRIAYKNEGDIVYNTGTSTDNAIVIFDGTTGKVVKDSGVLISSLLSNPVPLIYGSTADNGDITIRGTSSATKDSSYVLLQDTGGAVGIGSGTIYGKLQVTLATGTGSSASVGDSMILTDAGAVNPQELRMGINTAGSYSFIQSTLRGSAHKNLVLNPLGGSVGINTSSPTSTNGGLDIASGGLGLVIGADNLANTRTNATQKTGRIATYHYTNTEEPVLIASMVTAVTSNVLYIGGGSSAANCATSIRFYTASNSTTTTGTERLVIDSTGNVQLSTNNAWLRQTDYAGTSYINMFKVNASDEIDCGGTLNIDGYLEAPTDGGAVTIVDMPVTSASVDNTEESLTVKIDGLNFLKYYSLSDGAGSIDNQAIRAYYNIVPNASDGSALGTTALMWSDLFLASGGVINFNNGNYTLTHSAGILTANADFRITTTGTDATSVPTLGSTSTLTNKTISAGTLSGATTLEENASIDHDPSLSADGKYTGLAITGTAGATLAFGDLIYLDPTDSRWELADANVAAGADGDPRGILGMCVLAAAGDGSATKILLNGVIRADAVFPALTINAPVYVGETAGDIVVSMPSTSDVVIRIVGYGLTSDSIYFNPENDFITHI